MGSCNKRQNQEDAIKKIVSAINSDDPSFLASSLFKLYEISPSLDIHSPFINYNNYQLLPLSYSVIKGSSRCFEFMVIKNKAKIRYMIENLSKFNLSPIHIICEKGYIDLLKFYLPIYLNNRKKHSGSNYFQFNDHSNINLLTPIQLAVQNGHINIVQCLAQFDDTEDNSFSLSYVNPMTGENCALVSMYSGSFAMVKLLYEKFELDFLGVNYMNQGVYEILANEARSNYCFSHPEILMYLIEVIQVPVREDHEAVIEHLKKVENKSMLRYFELVLKQELGSLNNPKYESSFESSNGELSKIQKNSSVFSCSSEIIRFIVQE